MEHSIFEQLNKIDDKESLSEKYNVKDAREVHKLQQDFDEGIFGFGKKKTSAKSGSTKNTANKNEVERKVTFKIWDPSGNLRFNRTFNELPGKMDAEEQLKHVFMDNSSLYRDYCNNRPTDWTYERTSTPEHPSFDTKNKPGRYHFVAADLYIRY